MNKEPTPVQTDAADPSCTPIIHWEYLRKLMDFQEISYPTLSKMCGTPESTLRKLFQGATKDPRISTILPPVRILGASLDRTLGLAPARDFEREEAAYDVTVMDTMRHQVAELMKEREMAVSKNADNIAANSAMIAQLSEKIEKQSERLEFKAGKIQEQELELTELRTTLKARELTIKNLESMYHKRDATVNTLRRELGIMRYVTAGFSLLLVCLCAYFVWELTNPRKGLTGLFF